MHPNAKDIRGQFFGYLEVLDRAGTTKRRSIIWRCRCHLCGRVKNISAGALGAGRSQTCGCYRHNRLPRGLAAFHDLVRRYRNDARRSGRDWALTRDDCLRLFKLPCHYCGAPPQQGHSRGAKKSNGTFIYNGLDRRDNNLGYHIGNVVPCCSVCNRAKLKQSEEEFIAWILRVVEHLKLRS